MATKTKAGRKFGRNAKRSPSMAQYRGANRMAVNKRKAIEKHSKQCEKQQSKTLRVPRGTARNKRRAAKQAAYAAKVGETLARGFAAACKVAA